MEALTDFYPKYLADLPPYFGIITISRVLQIHPGRARQYIEDGELPADNVNGLLIVNRSDFVHFVDKHIKKPEFN